MRRFLDWTAGQPSGGSQQQPQHSNNTQQNNNRRNSHQGQQANSNQREPQPSNPARELELQHLTKLLHEIKYYQASSSPLPSVSGSQNQLEFSEKVHKTLPLFLKVFNQQQRTSTGTQHFSTSSITSTTSIPQNQQQIPPTDAGSSTSIPGIIDANLLTDQQQIMSDNTFISESSSCYSPRPTSAPLRHFQSSSLSSATNLSATIIAPQQMERFPDLLPFAFTIARLFVSEVRQRASNKHAEDASLAILQFLNPIKQASPKISSLVKSSKDEYQHEEETPSGHHESSSSTSTSSSSMLSETAQGWNLLLSLNTLALSQSTQIIQLLCDASLPSTLIKCLYLFFDLPEPKNSVNISSTAGDLGEIKSAPETSDLLASKQSTSSSSTMSTSATREMSVNCGPLIKAFTQLLVQLCSYQSAIDELIKKDDLRLLVAIASSQCLKCNRAWRRTAFQTMLAISKNMKDNFYYLDTNLCIQVYVENMHRLNSLGLVSIDEHIDMIKVLLEFIHNLDTNNRNQTSYIEPIIEQFKSSRITDLIEEVLTKLDESISLELSDTNSNKTKSSTELQSESDDIGRDSEQTYLEHKSLQQQRIHSNNSVEEYRRYAKRLMQSLTIMAKINVCQDSMINIVSLKPLTTSRFEMFEQFRMPKPTAKNCVLNTEVLRLFKMFWSKCQDNHIIEAILDATISLFNDDKYNYFIFESQQLLVYYMTSNNFSTFPVRIKQKLFKFLEFIIIETNYIPCLELGTLGTIITKKSTSNVDLILGLRTLIACLKFNSKFSDIFKEIGLLEVVIELLTSFMQKNENDKIGFKQGTENIEILSLLLETSQYLLVGPNNANCIQFNESGAARHVFNCLSKPDFFHFIQGGSSSDDYNIPSMFNTSCGASLTQSRTNTPPLSASHLRSSGSHTSTQHFSEGLTLSKPSVKQLQKFAFTIIRYLILSTAGDEHLANLLGLLARNFDDLKLFKQSSANSQLASTSDNLTQDDTSEIAQRELQINFALMMAQEVNLKINILKSLMIILKDSHRCRSLFRKAGGFIYIVSSLVTLEKALPLYNEVIENDSDGCFDSTEHSKLSRINSRRVWRLIKNCLMTIVVAIRSEPANLRNFSDEVLGSFTQAIRNLGCFKADQKSLLSEPQQRKHLRREMDDNIENYKSIFLSPPTRDYSTLPNDNIGANEAACQLLRFLFDMSIDMADGTNELEIHFNQYQQDLSCLRSITTTSKHQSNVDLKSMSFDQDATHHHHHQQHQLIRSSQLSHYSQQLHQKESNIFQKRSQLNMAPKRPPSLDLENKDAFETKAYLSYPSVVMSILDLIPSCPSEDLMVFMGQVIKSFFNHERNIQMLCEAGMISKLLAINWRISIMDKNHILYETVEFMFEKLTRQLITPKELRMFLRLNNPMKCMNLDEIEVNESSEETRRKFESERNKVDQEQEAPSLKEDQADKLELDCLPSGDRKPVKREKILTDRVRVLVEMMALDERKNQLEPPHVEFNMSTQGFSSIFMPSIAPTNIRSLPQQASSFLNSTLEVHTNEKNGILGGVGAVERAFPPSSGLSFSTWFYIKRFPARSSDLSHNLRLLTIYRGSASTGKEYSCFRIQISALDRALTISTQETLLFDNDSQHHDPDCNLRIWTPELLSEGKWHHLVVTLNRSASKQSRIYVYVDGLLVHHQRICYISNFVGSSYSGALGNMPAQSNYNSAAAFVNAFIGSLPQYRLQLKTQWKQGPCHLVEEVLSPNFVAIIHALGPKFIGNFQSSAKFYDLAKNNMSSQQQLFGRFNQPQSSETPSGAHRPLAHQKSAGGVSSVHHQQQLMRVSSSSNPPSQQQGTASGSPPTSHPQGSYHISEERILMSVDARAASLMSLARMRKIYTKFDCRQVGRVLGLAMSENATPILLLHNTGVHLNGPSRGIGAITIAFSNVRWFVPSPSQQTIISLGGCYILLGLVAQAETVESFYVSLQALVSSLKYSTILEAQMENINGYQILSVFFWKKKHLLNADILKLTFSLITDTANVNQKQVHGADGLGKGAERIRCIHQVGALRDLICECFDLWLQTDMLNLVLEFIYDLISSSPSISTQFDNSQLLLSSRTRNLKCLRDMDLLPRMLRLLPQYDSQQVDSHRIMENLAEMRAIVGDSSEQQASFDTKAVYLIKQTVFELLNRTPRQSDLLYFGHFLASLLPSNNKERPARTISLRNILLKSLIQMMTKNKQIEINNAMQEEIVKILGFDWFMLFISGPHLDLETVTLGLLNLMIVLSNDHLYASFRCPAARSSSPSGGDNATGSNGSWLKEPIFPTMDGKFNIQLLGINVGVFFGLGGRRKSIKQEVLEAPNFFLLTNCLRNLIHLPRIYLIIFQTMMSTFTSKLEANAVDIIESFEDLTLDTLCDSLVGDTHHKRRQTLSGIQFRCHELVVCLIYMIRDIMSMEQEGKLKHYPEDICRFLMYLYNNNLEFQRYCRRSNELIDALSESLMESEPNSLQSRGKEMTGHPASKEILELSRLIILDTMTSSQLLSADQYNSEQSLQAFERFLDCLAECREAQGNLVDMLLRQILLMIDSTARHNSIKTIGSQSNVQQFQLLLTNSILIAQIVTDKIWSKELYADEFGKCLTIIDHQLCLAEQTFKFNELLPKNNPPFAFIIQRVLNRIILFALSRPIQHISDKMLQLDLLKKIYDHRTIIILTHMHSPQSAEFFVNLTYCLMKIIEDNSVPIEAPETPTLIERQYGHPSPSTPTRLSPLPGSSSDLMLVGMAKKVWDAVYQSKKGILSEAFDVSLSLPAFTLDTSLDLIQLKPEIVDCCERYWASFIESELKQSSTSAKAQQRRNHLGQKSGELASASNTPTASAVNILSGRLTKVVNAASFVSRVVGATAGSITSNVNQVGERISSGRGAASSGFGRKESCASSGRASEQATPTSADPLDPLVQVDQSDLFKSAAGLSKSQIEEAAQTHISIIEDFIESQLSQKNHKLALHKYLCDEWLDIEQEVLLRERALFGPERGSLLDKWCLDMTEGPRRMRKKMVNNTRHFYDHYPYTPEKFNPSNKSLRYRPPMSYDSHLYYLKTLDLDQHLLRLTSGEWSSMSSSKATKTLQREELQAGARTPVPAAEADPESEKRTPSAALDGDTPQDSREEPPNRDCHSSIESLKVSLGRSLPEAQANSPSPKPSENEQDDGDSTSFVDFSPEIEAETNSARESAENMDSLTVLRLLEKNERISHMFRCSRVQGLDTYEGLLLFGREHFYLIDGFTLLKTREIKDIDSLPADAHDPIIPNSTPNILAAGQNSKKICAKFSFDSVVEVHKRRYLLQPIALEVFSSDGRNTLIVFPRNIRNKVYSRLMAVSTQLTNNASESLAGQKSNVSVEGGSGLLSNLIGETSVTQRWVRGELSNFQYLMNLNTIAGRSYNDLMQYPIFPWILADYSSESLDFSKPATFRDLSRPVGAQTSERLEQFKRRFSDWDDTETPPYHYGTFYSSAMIVASYMVRMEPFTQHFLRLQGGHFDLADRMFHSVKDSWLSASKHNMADIKELIPEFFYLPEFLQNTNKFDLGIKQNGQKLNDVVLPPWAKGDAREFIRIHRSALESDYVSAHLHEWIDLIFGYKQQGQPAVDAVNVFHHLFYEGNVDIYNTDIDPIKKNAVIGFINNFGQVPKQLFKKPHPARKVTSTSFLSNSSQPSMPLTPSLLPALSSTSSSSVPKVITNYPETLKQTNPNLKELRGPVGQIIQMDGRNIVAVEQNKLLIPPEHCRYIAWGHADRSLRLGLYDSEKPIFVWEGSELMFPHDILCCTIPNNRTMITAGTESLITVWKIEKMKSFSPQLHLYGHVEPVTCLASSQSYSIVVSGSRDRTAIIWDLNRFTFVCQLGGASSEHIQHHGPISAIAINDSTGDIATCAGSWLYLWTINGQLLAHVNSMSVSPKPTNLPLSSSRNSPAGLPPLGSSQVHLLSICFSQYNEWDSNEVILTGASDGSVAVWSMRYYQAEMDTSDENQEELIIEKADEKPQKETGNLEQQQVQNQSPNKDDTTNPIEQAAQSAATSEPIVIRTTRKRTETMNSDWVKLSTSSNSTGMDVAAHSLSKATPPSLEVTSNGSMHDMMASVIKDLAGSVTETSAGFFPQDRHQTSERSLLDGSTDCIPARDFNSTETSQTENENSKENDRLATNNLLPLEEQSMKTANTLVSPSDPSFIKFSKSDTSLVDSFVLLGDPSGPTKQSLTPSAFSQRPQSSTGTGPPNRLSVVTRTERKQPPPGSEQGKRSNKLLPGHCWKRELYLRAMLRANNMKGFVPAVTSITISKDHKMVFLGDASGRISSWTTG